MSDHSLFDYLRWIALHLGGWLLILLPAYGAGRLCLRRVRFASRLEGLVFSLAVGLGACGLLLFGLGLCGLLYRQALIAGSALVALLTAAFLARSWREGAVAWKQWMDYPRRRRMLIAAAVTLAVGYWLLLLLLAQYPPLHWDALEYHLTLARDYLGAHRVVVNQGVVYPVLPALNHLLFTWALALGDDALAQMVEHTFLMLAALGLYAWGGRLKNRALGAAAAACWLAHPLVLWLGESAYVDVGLTAFAFLGVYALRVFWDEGGPAWWLLGIALFGFAAGTKITGLFFLPIGIGLGLLAWRRKEVRFWDVAQGMGLALLVAAPWYAWIGSRTGNPVWPILAGFSRGIWGAPGVAEGLHVWANVGVEKTSLNFLLLPFYFISQNHFFPDNNRPLLPLMTFLPLAWVVMWKDRSVRWWTLWALGFTLYWFLSSQQVRLWLPALPFVTLAVYESLPAVWRRWRRLAARESLIWSALALLAVATGLMMIAREVRVKGWPPVTTQAREQHLTNLCSGYAGVSYINQHARADEAVYLINANWLVYYLRPRVLDMNALLQREVWPTFRWPDDERWVRYLEAQGVNWILVNHASAPAYLNVYGNPRSETLWPGFQRVYADARTWVFRRQTAAQGR
jgi:hypothetical protein